MNTTTDLATIDRDSSLPIYHQIRCQIEDKIRTAILPAGTRLPSELRLARMLSISAMTVRQAYNELAENGLVVRRHGAGTYVNRFPADVDEALPPAGKYRRDVAVLLTRFSSALRFYTPILHGMEAVDRELGYQIHLVTTNRQSLVGGENLVLRNLIESRQLDGVIFGGYLAPKDTQFLEQIGVPFILVDNDFGGAAASVFVDDVKAATRVTEMLVQAGHRHLALVAGPAGVEDRPLRRSAKLADGFRSALAANNLTVPADAIRFCDFSAAAADAAVRELLARSPHPTTIIVDGDELAKGVRAGVDTAGLRVPADVVIAVYADSADHPLAVAVKPLEEMGRAALRLLDQLIHGESPPSRSVILDPVFSTTPPPSPSRDESLCEAHVG